MAAVLSHLIEGQAGANGRLCKSPNEDSNLKRKD